MNSYSAKNFQEVAGFPDTLHSIVLPIVIIKENQFKPIGTCFVVNPISGFLVTAKHNIEEAYEFESFGNNVIDTKKYGHMHVYYVSQVKNKNGDFVGDFLPVRQIYMSEDSDTAILRTQIPVLEGKSAENSLLKGMRLSPGIPNENIKCIGFGYNKMDWQVISDREKTIELALSLNSSPGKIEEIHFPHRDPLLIYYPCFRTNARFDGGMSGGPVLSEHGQVCGIITKSYDKTDDVDHISYVALTTCLFPIQVWNNPDNEDAGKKFIFELIKENKILCDSSFDEFSFEHVDDKVLVRYKGEKIMSIKK